MVGNGKILIQMVLILTKFINAIIDNKIKQFLERRLFATLINILKITTL